MLTVPFAAKLGSALGASIDGVIHGVLPKIAPTSALSEAHLAPITSIYRGNADSAGGVNWTDVTTSANNDTIGDVSLFDSTNPTKDMLCLELSSGDSIGGISLLISTAAALTGTPVAEVRYRTLTGWGTATGIVTPSLTSTGLRSVLFDEIDYADISPTDNVLDPFGAPQQRCLYLRFLGITAVTVAPLFTRVWKKISHTATHSAINYTAAVSQGTNPDFSALQSAILPVTGDLTLMGFDAPVVRLHPTIYRPTASGLGQREWVYSKSDGSFSVLPAGNIQDPSNLISTPKSTGAAWAAVAGLSGITEWYSPDALTAGALSTWVDGAGTANNLTASGSPTVIANAYNGKPTVRFDGIDDYFDMGTPKNDARTVFVVFKEDAADADDDVFLLGHATTYHYHRGASKQILVSGTASANVTGGTVRVNGAVVDPLVALYPTALSILSFENTGVTDIGKIGRDRAIAGRFFFGDICEILILNTTISAADRETVEGYLAHKYGLQESLSAAHKYRYYAPGTVPVPHQININPPTDWGTIAMTDAANVQHTRYWIGWRYTGDTAAPVLPVNFTVRGQPVMATGFAGIPAPETSTYTSLTIACRETSAVAETLLLINGQTGKTAAVTVPANAAVATTAISLPVAKGDAIALVHVSGSSSAAIGDGAVFVS